MQKTFKLAVRVPFVRVVLAVATLTVLPSFSLNTRTDTASVAAATGPVGVKSAEAKSAVAAKSSSSVARRTAGESRAMAALSRSAWEGVNVGRIDLDVFELALGAASCAIKNGDVDAPRTLTVIDYSRPSTAKRMWVYDLRSRELLYEELVAHGQGSGANYATNFSNQPESHRTSIGLFVTDDTYVGRNGYSLRMNGLDRGFNDRARERAIVMHGAPYVSESFVKAQGRLGRSHGCPAVRAAIARDVIDTVKGGGLVFSYYPDQKWLKSSKYLSDCNAT